MDVKDKIRAAITTLLATEAAVDRADADLLLARREHKEAEREVIRVIKLAGSKPILLNTQMFWLESSAKGINSESRPDVLVFEDWDGIIL